MTSRNDITGDLISTKSTSDAYRDNYDFIFKKKTKKSFKNIEQPNEVFIDECPGGFEQDYTQEQVDVMNQQLFQDTLTEAFRKCVISETLQIVSDPESASKVYTQEEKNKLSSVLGEIFGWGAGVGIEGKS